MQDPRSLPVLLLVLQDKNQYVRGAAEEALGLLEDSRALDPLVQTFSLWQWDSSYSREDHSIEALRRLPREQVVSRLQLALKDQDANIRAGAAIALGELEKKEEAKEPSDAAQGEETTVAGDPAPIDGLIAKLKDKKDWSRGKAARALGLTGDPRAQGPGNNTDKMGELVKIREPQQVQTALNAEMVETWENPFLVQIK